MKASPALAEADAQGLPGLDADEAPPLRRAGKEAGKGAGKEAGKEAGNDAGKDARKAATGTKRSGSAPSAKCAPKKRKLAGSDDTPREA